MAEKTLNTRIIHKHDTAANWDKAENFIPNKGELIVYDIDADYDYERFKIGDGIHSVNELPFADDDLRKNVENKVDKVEGKDLSTNDFTDAEKEKLAAAVLSVNGITPDENGRLNTAVIIENDESTGNISIIRNPDLLWFALQSDPSASDISIFQRVAYEEDNSQDYLMINTELESLVFSQTDEIVVEIWRLGFGGYAPDLLVDNIAHTVTLDPDWVAPAEPITEWVQSDWNESDENNKAFIKNKPELATDDDILALMMEVDALPVVMDESGAIMTDEEGAILLA